MMILKETFGAGVAVKKALFFIFFFMLSIFWALFSFN